MASMLGAGQDSVDWTFVPNGDAALAMAVSFNADGTAVSSGIPMSYTVGLSGNSALPVAFILQAPFSTYPPPPASPPDPSAPSGFAVVYCGSCNFSTGTGAGYFTNGYPESAPGVLGTFAMTLGGTP